MGGCGGVGGGVHLFPGSQLVSFSFLFPMAAWPGNLPPLISMCVLGAGGATWYFACRYSVRFGKEIGCIVCPDLTQCEICK